MAFETQSSAPRAKDTAGTIQEIKTFSENADGSGEQIQAVALTGIDGAKAGVPALPLHVQGAVLTAIETALGSLATEVKLEAVRALLASLDGKDFATAANQLPDGHNVTVDNPSIPVTGTFWPATQPISAAALPVLGGTQPVEEQETPPTDASKNNPSFALTYVAGDLTQVDMVIGAVTYRKTLTYVAGDLTAVGAWAAI